MDLVRRSIQIVMALAVLASGVAGGLYLKIAGPKPPLASSSPPPPSVLVEAVEPTVFDEPIVGYGTVRPKRQLKIIPQVTGMITAMHDDLEVGRSIDRGETLFEIDRRAYESQVKQVEAEVELLQIQLERHDLEKQNLEEGLANAQALLAIAERDLERERQLAGTDATSAKEVDLARQGAIKAADAVQQYENKLALIPHLKAETLSRLEMRTAALEDAQRNLDSTTIVCPYDARVDLVTAQESQVVIANLAIATLTDLEAFELAAVLDPADLQWADRQLYARAIGVDEGEPPAIRVAWTFQNRRQSWTGHVSRLERHDEATRTARLVVEIPNEKPVVDTGDLLYTPQLSIGMFCSAEIPAEPVTDALVLPRHAIHEDDLVYVFEPDSSDSSGLAGTLRVKHVPLLRSVGDRVLVAFAESAELEGTAIADAATGCELEPGDQIILSPLPRPVPGMRLARRVDASVATVSPGRKAATPLDIANAIVFASTAHRHAGDAVEAHTLFPFTQESLLALFPTVSHLTTP